MINFLIFLFNLQIMTRYEFMLVNWVIYNYVTMQCDNAMKKQLMTFSINGAPQGGGGSGAMCYVQNSLACYVLCKFLFTLLCEIKIGCYAEV